MAEDQFRRDYAAIAREFARQAALRKNAHRYCKWVRLAARRHLEDLKRARQRAWPYVYDEWHANDVCDFVEKLPHVEGVWDSPTITLSDWQIFCLAMIFGWRRRADGLRRFTTVYLEVARKNGKSTLLAAIALYCLCCEGEVGPQILIGATTGDQAGKVFEPAKRMVQRTPDLCEAFGLQAWARSITCADNGGYIRPINAKSSTQDGHNPHVAILDELHAHKDRGLYDVLKSAFGARRNPLLIAITTAGYNVMGVCFEQRSFVAKVLEGLVEADHYWGVIFTLDEDDDEFDERCWIKANPNLDVSVQREELRGYAAEARANPGTHGEFKTKRMNVWTTAREGHVNITLWQRCGGEVDLRALEGRACWGGLDLASTTDLTSFRLVWRDGDRVLTWGRRYLPEEAAEPRTKRGNVPYLQWVHSGHLILTPGNVTDYEFVRRDIQWAMERFRIRSIAYDPWNAREFAPRLLEEGVPMVEFRQGIPSYHGAVQELDRLYLSGKLVHGGDPVLAWCASNMVVRRDANDNMAPDKKHSLEKIDDMVALLMAIGRMIEDQDDGPSVYETRGIRWI